MADRPMRKIDHQISEQNTAELLLSAEHGVPATVNTDGTPYSRPFSQPIKTV